MQDHNCRDSATREQHLPYKWWEQVKWAGMKAEEFTAEIVNLTSDGNEELVTEHTIGKTDSDILGETDSDAIDGTQEHNQVCNRQRFEGGWN